MAFGPGPQIGESVTGRRREHRRRGCRRRADRRDRRRRGHAPTPPRTIFEFEDARPRPVKGKAEPARDLAADRALAAGSASICASSRAPRSSGPRTTSCGVLRKMEQFRAQLARRRSAARHPDRRAGRRQDPADARVLRLHRRAARAGALAPGPVPAVRRGRHVLGARRDRQGPGRHPGFRRPRARPARSSRRR